MSYLSALCDLCILYTFIYFLYSINVAYVNLEQSSIHRASDISWKKKSKISRGFQRQIRGKIDCFREIFAGKKSKFAEKSSDFT